MKLAARKNEMYSGTIDNVGSQGLEGIAVALLNKATRLFSLVIRGHRKAASFESIRDTLLDAGNYADFGVAICDGTWRHVVCKKEKRWKPKSR